MKNLYLIVIVLFFLPMITYSQGENDNWYFGEKAGINFSTTPPSAFYTSQMIAGEGSSSISDSNGQILFYTDGKRVYDSNNQIMPNGSALTGTGFNDVQGSVILPNLANSSQYYIFTVNGSQNFAAFSIVDMTLNGGLGDVAVLNTPLLNQFGNSNWNTTVEAITTVSGIGNYWVVLPNQNKLLAYSVDQNGVNTSPIISDINLVDDNVSHIRISPNKEFIAITEFYEKRTTLYNFNSTLGQVDSPTPIAIITASTGSGINYLYATEFSIDSEKLWLSTFSKFLFGFDLADLNSPPLILDTNSNSAITTIQNAINNEMYFSVYQHSFLSKINNPTDFSNTSFTLNSIGLSTTCKYGLPQLIPTLDVVAPCPQDLILNTIEQNTNFIYETSNSITTTQNYNVSSGQNITLSAGNFIEMLPNTSFQTGAIVLAKIEGCIVPFNPFIEGETINITINLDKDGDKEKSLVLYPNPASNNVMVSISSNDEIINKVSVSSFQQTDLITKNNIQKSEYLLEITNLKQGIYIINIETSSGQILTKKLIKE